MAERQIDTSRLQGEALQRWYLRSPQDEEQERQATAAQRYDDFFHAGSGAAFEPGIGRGPASPAQDVDPGISLGRETPSPDIEPGISWIPAGPNRWRRAAVASDSPNSAIDLQDEQQTDGAFLDKGLAGPDDGGQLVDVGNPANRRLKQEYERAYGPWPRTGGRAKLSCGA